MMFIPKDFEEAALHNLEATLEALHHGKRLSLRRPYRADRERDPVGVGGVEAWYTAV